MQNLEVSSIKKESRKLTIVALGHVNMKEFSGRCIGFFYYFYSGLIVTCGLKP